MKANDIFASTLTKRPLHAAFLSAICLFSIIFTSCKQIEQPPVKPFFAESPPPRLQELRWTNGKAPKSLDPAFASAAPETDIVRAIYEGLTEIDPKKLTVMPGIAEKWTASDDKLKWTFTLRKDAHWNNGKRVTANDFVATFKRLASFGTKAAHSDLFQNIVGMRIAKPRDKPASADFDQGHSSPQTLNSANTTSNFQPKKPTITQTPTDPEVTTGSINDANAKEPAFGVVAINEDVLEISLIEPDDDFPLLLSNPIFRPVYNAEEEIERGKPSNKVVSNGAFTISSINSEGTVLVRSENYWDRTNVKLEKVIFVPKDTAESALEAYKNGDVDAVSNASFEPLALKLLTPFKDFRQTVHGALNFYEINSKVAALSDRRVREALAISINRERMTDGELEGSMMPATSFLPYGTNRRSKLTYDVVRASELLASAGYPAGDGFPKLRLVINRNDTQQRVARSVTRMWKQNLNIDIDIVVKDTAELELARATGDFDLLRRGIVLPTANATAGLTAIFGIRNVVNKPDLLPKTEPTEVRGPSSQNEFDFTDPDIEKTDVSKTLETESVSTGSEFTENVALFELNSIPLYFPTAHLLVKPYVIGFDVNALDAPLLQQISIDSNWAAKADN